LERFVGGLGGRVGAREKVEEVLGRMTEVRGGGGKELVWVAAG